MLYIGKIWLKTPLDMIKVADILSLNNVVSFETDDVVGTMKWRGGEILVLLHLSWGDRDNAEKIRIFAHHLKKDETDDFWILIKELLKNIISNLGN